MKNSLNPNFKKHKMNKIVQESSSTRCDFGIFEPQLRHFPKVISQLISGISSIVLKILWHLGHCDFSPKYRPKQDWLIGKRCAKSVEYEPKTAPKKPETKIPKICSIFVSYFCDCKYKITSALSFGFRSPENAIFVPCT